MRRYSRAAGAALMLLIALAGCGVPDPALVGPYAGPRGPARAGPGGPGRVASPELVESARARTLLEQMVFYGFDESGIGPEGRRILGEKAMAMRANPGVRLRVVGHADERGSTEYNLALGMRRAQSAVRVLVEHGVEPGRLQAHTLGEEQPLDPRHYEAAWARNRRSEFHVLSGGDNLRVPPELQ